MHATLVRTVPITRSRLAKEPNYVGICETWITLEAKTECFEKHSTNNLKRNFQEKIWKYLDTFPFNCQIHVDLVGFSIFNRHAYCAEY